MYIFSKSKRAARRQKLDAEAAHRLDLAPYLPANPLNPHGALELTRQIGYQMAFLLFSLVFAAFAAAFAALILSNPYENIARILLWGQSVTEGTADFGTLYGGFSAAVVLLSLSLFSLIAWLFSYIEVPFQSVMFDQLVELDDRAQDQLAELRLAIDQLKQTRDAK